MAVCFAFVPIVEDGFKLGADKIFAIINKMFNVNVMQGILLFC